LHWKRFATPAELPLTNYMAYTDDTCQTGFTTQQAARVQCYISSTLNFILEGHVPPVAAPKAVSSTSQLSVVGLLAAAGLYCLSKINGDMLHNQFINNRRVQKNIVNVLVESYLQYF